MSPTGMREKVSEFPKKPGVYLMKDEKGRVIYIGKAKSLRDRVTSYFQPSRAPDPKIDLMISQVADVEYLEADSEVDALLIEARLVKDIQPKYNKALRDDKSFPYIEVVLGDDFPGVYITRIRERRESKFYGPFLDVKGLRFAAKTLQEVFKFRTCNLMISAEDRKRRYNRPCLLYYVERCTAPCAACVKREEYMENIRSLQRFLEGGRVELLNELEEKMKTAAEKLQYEKAARFRDQLKALKSLDKKSDFEQILGQGVGPIDPSEGLVEIQELLHLEKQPRTIEGIDVSNISGQESCGSVVTFVDGIPFKAGYRRFKIKTVDAIDDYAMIREVVGRRFSRLVREDTVMPDVLLIDGGQGHLNAAVEQLNHLKVGILVTAGLAKKEEVLYIAGHEASLKLPRDSAALRLLQHVRDEAHRFAQHYHHILRKKRTFN